MQNEEVFLEVPDVLEKGLQYLAIQRQGRSKAQQVVQFHKHYGSDPLPIGTMWFDLTATTIPQSTLTEEEKMRGFKMFMVAHYFLWVRPKNAHVLASRFQMCERNARGAHLWVWIGRIAGLLKKVIKFPRNPGPEKYYGSIDGVDLDANETKHHRFNVDPGYCSHKFNHCAVKYQIVLSVHSPQCYGIFGPKRGGENDKTLLEESGVLEN